jgi:hypothetical protein
MPRAAQKPEPSAHEDERAKSKPGAVAGKKPVASKTTVSSAAAPVTTKRPVQAAKRPVLVVAKPAAAPAPKTSGKKHSRDEEAEASEQEEQVVTSKSSKKHHHKEGSSKKHKKSSKKDEAADAEEDVEAEASGSEDEPLEEERAAMQEGGEAARKKPHLMKVHLADESVAAGVVRNIRKQEKQSKRSPASALAPLANAIKYNLKQHSRSRWYGSQFGVKPDTDETGKPYRAYSTGVQKARRLVEGLLVRTFDGAYQQMRSYHVSGKEIKPEKITATRLKKRANSRPKTLMRGHIITYLLSQPELKAHLAPFIKRYINQNPSVAVFVK